MCCPLSTLYILYLTYRTSTAVEMFTGSPFPVSWGGPLVSVKWTLFDGLLCLDTESQVANCSIFRCEFWYFLQRRLPSRITNVGWWTSSPGIPAFHLALVSLKLFHMLLAQSTNLFFLFLQFSFYLFERFTVMVWYSIVDIVFFRLSWNSRKKLSSLAQGLQQVLIKYFNSI